MADHLLAGVFDQLAIANWQRSGGKSDPPQPFPRPGTERELHMMSDDRLDRLRRRTGRA